MIRYNGKVWRVQKQPFESDEQAKDRVWYVVKNMHEETDNAANMRKWECLSRMWSNEKYYAMKY